MKSAILQLIRISTFLGIQVYQRYILWQRYFVLFFGCKSSPRSILNSFSEISSSVFGVSSELLLNSQKLVVFCKSFRSARSSSLNLTCAKTNNQVSNETILSLTRPEKFKFSLQPEMIQSTVLSFCYGLLFTILINFDKSSYLCETIVPHP